MSSSPVSSPGSVRSRGTRRARVGAVVAVVALLPLLSACGADFNAQTNVPYQPAEGISVRDGDVYSLNTLVVTDGDGNGTVVARLVNQQSDDDALTSFTATDPAGNTLTTEPLASPVPLATFPHPEQSVQVGTDGALRMDLDGVGAGSYVTLTFNFDKAAPVTVDAPVVAPGTVYADIPVGPSPTATTASG